MVSYIHVTVSFPSYDRWTVPSVTPRVGWCWYPLRSPEIGLHPSEDAQCLAPFLGLFAGTEHAAAGDLSGDFRGVCPGPMGGGFCHGKSQLEPFEAGKNMGI